MRPKKGPVDIKRAIKFYHKTDAKTVAWLVQQAILTKSGFEFILRLKPKTGKQRLVQSIANVQTDNEGNPESLFGLFRDVTKQVSEQQRSASRAKLVRAIITNSPTPIAVFDKNMCHLEASPSWISHHDFPKKISVIGRSYYSLVPDMPEQFKQEHERALKGDIIRRKVTGKLSTQLGANPMDIVEFPWKGPSGEIGGIIIMITTSAKNESDNEAMNQIASLMGD